MEPNLNQHFEARPLGKALQARTLVGAPDLPKEHRDLFKKIRALLLHASSSGALNTRPEEIHKLLLSVEPKGSDGLSFISGGGSKQGERAKVNLHRDRSIPHFERQDGGWFDFGITLAARKSGPLELHSYRFELRFPDDGASPEWIRFDLNKPDAEAAEKELRAHVHPGHKDLRAPSPLMNPDELLELLIYGLKR